MRERKHDNSMLTESLRALNGYITDYPFEDPLRNGRTMTPTQFQIALVSLDMSKRDITVYFQKPPRAVERWLSGAEPIPMGIADWLRMRLITRIKAMVNATGAPTMLAPDPHVEKPSARALSMIAALIKNLNLEQRFWSAHEEGVRAETSDRSGRDTQSAR